MHCTTSRPPIIMAAFLLCALFCLAAAQEGKEKVAFYLSGEEPKKGIYAPLSGFITKAIVNSGTYMAVDRTKEVLNIIAKEQTYQMTGAVDDAQISELGKQWGAKYVIAIKATKSIDGFYLEAKMVDVEKAYVAKMGEATSKLVNDDDLRAAADKIIRDLGIGGGASAGGGSNAVAQTATTPPPVNGSYFTDSRDGQKYRAVKIGGQTWMAENLNYRTGQSWCYGNDVSNCKKYGKLYGWNTAKGACPKGWQLPSRDDWDNLVKATGGKVDAAGKKLKSKTGWNDSKGESGNGADELGFSALPGGHRNYDGGSFDRVGNYGYWWNAAEDGNDGAYYREMGFNYDYALEISSDKSNGFSVRCVKD